MSSASARSCTWAASAAAVAASVADQGGPLGGGGGSVLIRAAVADSARAQARTAAASTSSSDVIGNLQIATGTADDVRGVQPLGFRPCGQAAAGVRRLSTGLAHDRPRPIAG